MGLFRKSDRAAFYDEELKRAHEELTKLSFGSDEYKNALATKKELIEQEGSEREVKRKISKSDRGSIIGKCIGCIALFGGGVAVAKFERDGNVFTGEKRTWVDTGLRILGQINPFR